MGRRKAKPRAKGLYWRKEGHDKGNRLFYSISEVAQMYDLEEHMLRTWEKHDLLKPQRSVSSGARMYTPEDLSLVQRLRYLIVEKGIQLSMVSKFIDLDELEAEFKMRDNLLEIKEKVSKLRKMVDEQLSHAKANEG